MIPVHTNDSMVVVVNKLEDAERRGNVRDIITLSYQYACMLFATKQYDDALVKIEYCRQKITGEGSEARVQTYLLESAVYRALASQTTDQCAREEYFRRARNKGLDSFDFVKVVLGDLRIELNGYAFYQCAAAEGDDPEGNILWSIERYRSAKRCFEKVRSLANPRISDTENMIADIEVRIETLVKRHNEMDEKWYMRPFVALGDFIGRIIAVHAVSTL